MPNISSHRTDGIEMHVASKGEVIPKPSGRTPVRMNQLIPVWMVVVMVLLAACASGPPAAEPHRDDVVAAMIDRGYEPRLARCVVGTAEGVVPLSAVLLDASETATEAVGELVELCEAAANHRVDGSTTQRPADTDDTPHSLGDDPEFDALWRQCEGGHGIACDALWQAAPTGSDYEAFGISCGRRADVLDCSAELIDEAYQIDIGDSQTTEVPS